MSTGIKNEFQAILGKKNYYFCQNQVYRVDTGEKIFLGV
jgi:hypothetical protein